jgi:beta-phosphoglucomutase-like phosphatase (HAD superfamily)
MKLSATMLDLDGTVVFQTREYIEDTVGKTIYDLGLEADKDFVDDFWYCNGSDRDKIIEDRLGIDYMKFWRIFWKNDSPEERARHTGVYDDVAALKNLRESGIKLGIVTGALTKVADAEISKVLSKVKGLRFDSIVSNNIGIKPKPHPDSLLVCMKELGVKNNETIYVGNANEDVQAAVAAQVKPVIVLREQKRKMHYGSSVKVINSLYEIENII